MGTMAAFGAGSEHRHPLDAVEGRFEDRAQAGQFPGAQAESGAHGRGRASMRRVCRNSCNSSKAPR